MTFGCAVARLSPPTKTALQLHGLGQNEVVTVTACGYGSPVTGQYPTPAQVLHKALCELGNLLGSTFHLRFSDIWQNAWTFMRDTLNNVLGSAVWTFRTLRAKIQNLPGVREIINGVKQVYRQLYQWAKTAGLAFLALIGVGLYVLLEGPDVSVNTPVGGGSISHRK